MFLNQPRFAIARRDQGRACKALCRLRAPGLAELRSWYRQPGFYDHLFAVADRLYAGMNAIFEEHEVPGRVVGLGARFGIYFGLDGDVNTYRDALEHNRELLLRFIAAAAGQGVYFHDYGGGACHHGFCAAMKATDVEATLDRIDAAVRSLKPAERARHQGPARQQVGA